MQASFVGEMFNDCFEHIGASNHEVQERVPVIESGHGVLFAIDGRVRALVLVILYKRIVDQKLRLQCLRRPEFAQHKKCVSCLSQSTRGALEVDVVQLLKEEHNGQLRPHEVLQNNQPLSRQELEEYKVEYCHKRDIIIKGRAKVNCHKRDTRVGG
jgi:hypothetical protein